MVSHLKTPDVGIMPPLRERAGRSNELAVRCESIGTPRPGACTRPRVGHNRPARPSAGMRWNRRARQSGPPRRGHREPESLLRIPYTRLPHPAQ
jgi:hypothetical protein